MNVQKIKKCCKEFVSAPIQSCLGIYTEKGRIYVAEIYKRNNIFYLSFFEEIVLDNLAEFNSEMLAEKVKMLCLQNNLKTENVSLCLPIDTVWWLEQEMPEMSRLELKHAVKYQIEGRGPYEDDKFWFGYVQGDNSLIITGSITEAEGKELIDNFQQNDLQLCGITMPKGMRVVTEENDYISLGDEVVNISIENSEGAFSNGGIAAVYAAYGGLNNKQFLNILPARYHLEEIEWKKLNMVVCCTALLMLVTVFCVNWWQIHQADIELQELQQQRNLTTKQIDYMHALQKQELSVKHKEEILSKLTKERNSMYAMMIHLGTFENDGIRLREVKYLGQGKFVCHGKAEKYNSVVAYLDEFDERKYYFEAHPKILETKTDENGFIEFAIEVRIKKGE